MKKILNFETMHDALYAVDNIMKDSSLALFGQRLGRIRYKWTNIFRLLFGNGYKNSWYYKQKSKKKHRQSIKRILVKIFKKSNWVYWCGHSQNSKYYTSSNERIWEPIIGRLFKYLISFNVERNCLR